MASTVFKTHYNDNIGQFVSVQLPFGMVTENSVNSNSHHRSDDHSVRSRRVHDHVWETDKESCEQSAVRRRQPLLHRSDRGPVQYI